MSNHCAVVFEVKKLPVGDFHHSLADNIIVCPGGSKGVLAIGSAQQHSKRVPGIEQEKPLQYTELQFLDDFRNTINDLGLAQINLCTLWRLHRAVVKCRTWQGDSS